MSDQSADFSDEIIDATLDTLADQVDAEAKQQLSGSFQINPQVFNIYLPTIQDLANEISRAHLDTILRTKGQERRHAIFGPIKFETHFDGVPDVTFGQFPTEIPGQDLSTGPVATTYTPFLLQAYLFRYTFTNGEVDGFYCGLYALTAPSTGVSSHTVSWQAVGKGSRYKQQDEGQSWTESYDYNEPEYLVDDTGLDFDDTTSDLSFE